MSDYEFWKDLGNIFDSILNYQKKNAEFNNRFINPWIRLGNIFDRDDQHKEAVQAYRLAIEIDPHSSQNWADLGDALFKMTAYDEAIAVYQKAIELDPKAGWPVSNLALTLVTQGKCEDAIPLFLTSIGLFAENKDKAVSWNRLGNAYRKLNDYENAFLAFQQADELDGENTGFRDQLDETTESSTMVAPEEVIVQMSMDEAVEVSAPVVETVAEVQQPETDDSVEDAAVRTTALELTDEPIAPAPDADMKAGEAAVELDTAATMEASSAVVTETSGLEPAPVSDEAGMHAEVIEDKSEPLPAWLEEEALEEQTDDDRIEEEQAEAESVEELVSEIIEEIVSLSEVVNAAEEPVAEIPVKTTTEEVKAEVLTEAALEEKVEVPVAAMAEEEKQEVPAAATVETVSTAQPEAAFNTSTTSMETYTEFTSTPVVDPSTLEDTQPIRAVKKETLTPPVSEETVEETAAQPEVQEEAGEVERESPFAQGTAPVAESAPVEELINAVTNEAAYDEYLKDVVEPASTLSDHMEDVHAGSPMTRVSQSGDVRIAMDTQNAHVWNELGNVYLNSGACDDAITAYGRAIELDRQFAWPYSNLALAYVQKSRFAEAILLYQRSIELFASDKDKAVTWNRLGNVYRRLNDYANAIAAYQTADDLDPDNATLSLRSHYGLLGNLYLEQKPNYVS